MARMPSRKRRRRQKPLKGMEQPYENVSVLAIACLFEEKKMARAALVDASALVAAFGHDQRAETLLREPVRRGRGRTLDAGVHMAMHHRRQLPAGPATALCLLALGVRWRPDALIPLTRRWKPWWSGCAATPRCRARRWIWRMHPLCAWPKATRHADHDNRCP